MDLQDYIEQARRTQNASLNVLERRNMVALGLYGELGEVADLFKKHLYHGHALDAEKVIEELGDFMWYVVYSADLKDCRITEFDYGFQGFGIERLIIDLGCWLMALTVFKASQQQYSSIVGLVDGLARHVGSSLEAVLDYNNTKLLKRYPDGFSHEASRNREAH